MPSSLSQGGSQIDPKSVLPTPFYTKVDPTDQKLTIRGKVNNVDSQVFKFGSGEADMFKINKIMGGIRQIKPNGEELFLIRQSTAGDQRAVSVGNMDTDTPNSLVCGPAGWRISRMLDTWVNEGAYISQVTTNSLGGTRIIIDHQSDNDASYRHLSVYFDQNIGDVKFNTRIYSRPSLELLSEHQPEAEFLAGGGLAKFKVNIVNNYVELPLSQPFPIPASTLFRIVYDFDKPVGTFSNSPILYGKKLELGRISPIVNMTRAQRLALPVGEMWDGRQVYQTDGPEYGLHTAQEDRWVYSKVPMMTKAERLAFNEPSERWEGRRVWQTDGQAGIYTYFPDYWYSEQPSRLTRAERNGLTTPEKWNGRIIYQTDGEFGAYIYVEDGNRWHPLTTFEMSEAQKNALTTSDYFWGRRIYQKDGANGTYTRVGARWVHDQASESRTNNATHEFAIIECQNGAWANSAIVLGGMEFRWSTNTINTGNLTMVRATGITSKSNVQASSIVTFNNGSQNSSLAGLNPTLWSTTVQQLHVGMNLGSAYAQVEHNIVSRAADGTTPSHWRIYCQHTGSNSLVMSGTYIGPKIMA